MEEYQEAMKIANIGKQQVLKDQMMTTARERVFYLTTLLNIMQVWYSGPLFYNVYPCYCTRRGSEASISSQQNDPTLHS